MKKILILITMLLTLCLNITFVFAEPILFKYTEDDSVIFTTEAKIEPEVVEDLKFIKSLATTETFDLFNENKQKEIEEQQRLEKEKRLKEQQKRNSMSATDNELDMLAKIIYAEARGESYDGKVAVGAVVLNRVRSTKYPNNIRDVIFARNQFSPVSDGSYYSARPSESEYQAARDALNGVDPTNGALTFYAHKSIYSRYHESLTHTATIGNHKFFK